MRCETYSANTDLAWRHRRIVVQPTKIHHLGIAVNDLEQARRIYGAMGLTITQTLVVPDQGVTVAWIPIGESRFELLQPASPASPVARFLERRGQGLHHVALQVTAIEEALAACVQSGLRPLDEAPRQGAEGRIAFLDPRVTAGVLIELVQPASAKEL
jgi:methylmalonyl-CoA epimerase